MPMKDKIDILKENWQDFKEFYRHQTGKDVDAII